MHRSTLAVRQTPDGWVIDATKVDGRVEQLIGMYTSEIGAAGWIADHPPNWWKPIEVE